jgi:hypothetical protein
VLPCFPYFNVQSDRIASKKTIGLSLFDPNAHRPLTGPLYSLRLKSRSWECCPFNKAPVAPTPPDLGHPQDPIKINPDRYDWLLPKLHTPIKHELGSPLACSSYTKDWPSAPVPMVLCPTKRPITLCCILVKEQIHSKACLWVLVRPCQNWVLVNKPTLCLVLHIQPQDPQGKLWSDKLMSGTLLCKLIGIFISMYSRIYRDP